MKTEWTLTREAFDNLLAWLSEDRDEGARKYEEIRSRLTRFFICRGSSEPEELTDETINRVIERRETRPPEYCENPIRFFYGVAKNVLREWRRKKKKILVLPVPLPEDEDQEQKLECLDTCTAQLSKTNRDLISQYYKDGGAEKIQTRRMLAQELGIEMNALRIKALRIRKVLEECVTRCMAGAVQ
jgi:DNA-directed RNA polymerase specialized sigma24 family protein